MIKVAIIVGSTRPGRKAEGVAKWVHDFDKSGAFKPASHHEPALKTMLDQLVAWGTALQGLRQTDAGRKRAA